MELARVVEILEKGKSCGSGYLLTPSIALTARHVVKPARVGTKCRIRPLRADQDWTKPQVRTPRPASVPARVDWISDRTDLALIRVMGDGLSLFSPATIPFGEIAPDGTPREILTAGFPEASGV